MKRREFLTLPAAAIGGKLLYTLAGEPMRLQAQNGTVKVPRTARLDQVKLVNGSLEITGLHGEVNASSVSGALSVASATSQAV